MLEAGIKKQLGIRLALVVGSTVASPVVRFITWVAMKYVIVPILEESEELIIQQVHKYQSKKKLREVNNAQTDTDFTDAFERL